MPKVILPETTITLEDGIAELNPTWLQPGVTYTVNINGVKYTSKVAFLGESGIPCYWLGNIDLMFGEDVSELLSAEYGIECSAEDPFTIMTEAEDEEMQTIFFTTDDSSDTVTLSISLEDGWALETTEVDPMTIYQAILSGDYIALGGIGFYKISDDPLFIDSIYGGTAGLVVFDPESETATVADGSVSASGASLTRSITANKGAIVRVMQYGTGSEAVALFVSASDDYALGDITLPKGCYLCVTKSDTHLIMPLSYTRYVQGNYRFVEKTINTGIKDFIERLMRIETGLEEVPEDFDYDQFMTDYGFISSGSGEVMTKKISDEVISPLDVTSMKVFWLSEGDSEENPYVFIDMAEMGVTLMLGTASTVSEGPISMTLFVIYAAEDGVSQVLDNYYFCTLSSDYDMGDGTVIQKGTYISGNCNGEYIIIMPIDSITYVTTESTASSNSDWFTRLFINEAKPALQTSKHIYELEVTVKDQNDDIKDYKQTISSQKTTIAERDATISSQKTTIAERDATISNQESTIANQKTIIAKRDGVYMYINPDLLKDSGTDGTIEYVALSYYLKNVRGNNMRYMFPTSATQIPLFDTSEITSMYEMFKDYQHLKTVPLFNTSNVTSMDSMFYDCRNLSEVPLFNTSNVTSMERMFYECASISEVPLFNTSNVTDMNSMFGGKSPETMEWDTGSVSTTYYGCKKLTTIPCFDTSNVTSMLSMFQYALALNSVPILNTKNVTDFRQMFNGCSALVTVPELDVRNASSLYRMFKGCTSLENCRLRNINVSLDLGDCHKLTKESALHIISELRGTESSDARTLTISENLRNYLSGIDIILTDITDDMRAEDNLIDEKLPFRYIDEGVYPFDDVTKYTTKDYLALKNWSLIYEIDDSTLGEW